MKKKLLSFALSAVMALSILAGAPTDNRVVQAASWEEDSVAIEEAEASSSVLKVYSWNTEAGEYINQFVKLHPYYKGKIELVNLGMSGVGDEYAREVKKILADTTNTSVIFVDADEVPLVNSYKGFSPLSMAGISNNDYANAYDYAKEHGTYNGQLYFASPAAETSSLVYNKAIAEKVLGTSDPEKVQEYVSTPEKYLETAAKMKKAGYYMTSGVGDMERMWTHTSHLISDMPGAEKIVQTSLNNGYDTKRMMYSEPWYVDMINGKTFSFFGATWFDQYIMPMGGDTKNMYRCCEGPISYAWGGYYIGIGNAGINKGQTETAREFIKSICCNADDMAKISEAHSIFPNNSVAAQKLIAAGKGKLAYMGSQQVFKVYAKTAPKVYVRKNQNQKDTVNYSTHVQSIGWQGQVSNGDVAGTSGLGKRLEGIKISLSGVKNLGVQYTTHVQSYGWLPWVSNGEMSGTEGEAKRLEAIMIKLTGANASKYDIYYRVHAQSYGWLGWAKNGEPAGTAGYGKRLEAIQIVLVAKGTTVANNFKGVTSTNSKAYVAATAGTPTVGGATNTNVIYRTHVQSYGWQGWKNNGQMSGTSGQAKRLEGINIQLTNKQYAGGITYRTHVQSIGWQDWRSNGAMSGTSGMAKRLEAIEIKLTGEMANQYDIYYRVHAQSFGWLGWAKNGASSGTSGLAKRLEGIQIVLVKKGGKAPANVGGIQSVRKEAYIKK